MNQLLDPENKTGKINLAKFPPNSKQVYKLNANNSAWIKDILIELNENAENHLPEEYLEESNLDANLEVVKKNNSTYGDYLLVTGKIEANFFTQCVRTLQEMKDHLDAEVKVCIIDHSYEKGEELKDEIDIFMDNDVYELHFYEKSITHLKDIIRELIFLNINEYPVSDYDSELPWSKEVSSTKQ